MSSAFGASGSAYGRWYVESDEGWIPVDFRYNGVVEGALRRGDAMTTVDGAITGAPFDYTVHFLGVKKALQTNDSTGRTRTLRRLPLTDYVWQFQDTSMAMASASATVPWKTYPNSELLEEEFGKGRAAAELVTLSASGQPVHIDLTRSIERNCATGATRSVRRVRRDEAEAGRHTRTTAAGATGSGGDDPDALVWRRLLPSEAGRVGEQCLICHEAMNVNTEHVVELRGCSGHIFHRDCVRPVLKPSGSLKCPLCSEVSGTPHTGTQPPGTMAVFALPAGRHRIGGLEGVGVIEIDYHLPSGIQGPEHPSPGSRYEGTRRKAYLPDTSEGREVLRLLQIAWERRLIFTVGTSITTGRENCVVWSGIHHKTSPSGGPYGYPDETFLARVKDELSGKGVS